MIFCRRQWPVEEAGALEEMIRKISNDLLLILVIVWSQMFGLINAVRIVGVVEVFCLFLFVDMGLGSSSLVIIE